MKADKDYSDKLIHKLLSIMDKIPKIETAKMVGGAPSMDTGIDYLIQVRADKESYILACEVKNNGQPRYVRSAINSLRAYMYGTEDIMTPVLLAPYLTFDSQELCREKNISFLDMEGNALIQFGGVYIDHRMPGKPVSEKRGLRSIFSPKSAQVLRMMLNDPLRTWKVSELSAEGRISIGHASNVRKNLLEREWAVSSDEGITLDNPGVLMNEWRENYRQITGTKKNFYTPLHGSALESQLRKILCCDDAQGVAILASFSAAQWLSPYGRTGMNFFYADDKGVDKLISGLKLSPTSKGANVTITIPKDEGIFLDTMEPAPGILTTGIVQTYLDLSIQGERGLEAAEHLRNEWMTW